MYYKYGFCQHFFFISGNRKRRVVIPRRKSLHHISDTERKKHIWLNIFHSFLDNLMLNYSNLLHIWMKLYQLMYLTKVVLDIVLFFLIMNAFYQWLNGQYYIYCYASVQIQSFLPNILTTHRYSQIHFSPKPLNHIPVVMSQL